MSSSAFSSSPLGTDGPPHTAAPTPAAAPTPLRIQTETCNQMSEETARDMQPCGGEDAADRVASSSSNSASDSVGCALQSASGVTVDAAHPSRTRWSASSNTLEEFEKDAHLDGETHMQPQQPEPHAQAAGGPTRFTFAGERSDLNQPTPTLGDSRRTTLNNTPQTSKLGSESSHLITVTLPAPIEPASGQDTNDRKVMRNNQEEKEVLSESANILACICQSAFGGGIYGYNTAIIAGMSSPMVDYAFFQDESSSFRASMTGILVSCILIGAFIGTIVSMPFTNRYGRRVGFAVCGVICVVSCVVLAFMDNFTGIVIVRTFLGLSVGMTTTICPLYSAECAPPEKRGKIGTVYQLSIVGTILVAQIVNYAFNTSNSDTLSPHQWRTQFGIGGVFGLGLIVMACLVPESPVWLAHRAKQQAKQQAKLRKRRSLSLVVDHPPCDLSVSGISGSIVAPPEDRVPKGWSGLFHVSNLKWIAVALLLSAGNQLTGVNAIIYYAPKIFEDAGYEDIALVLTIAVVGTWNFLTVLFSLPLINRMSRRSMMLIAQSIMTVGLLLITLAFAFFSESRAVPSIISILLFLLGFEIGPGPLFFILAAEVFPPPILHAGLSFANQVAWIFNIAITFLFPVLNNAIGAAGTFCIFLGVSVLTIIGYIQLLPADSDRNVIEADTLAMSPTSPDINGANLDQTIPYQEKVRSHANNMATMPSPPVQLATSEFDRPTAGAGATDSLISVNENQTDSPSPYQAKTEYQQLRQSDTNVSTEIGQHPL